MSQVNLPNCHAKQLESIFVGRHIDAVYCSHCSIQSGVYLLKVIDMDLNCPRCNQTMTGKIVIGIEKIGVWFQ
jgi:hypothetical protein